MSFIGISPIAFASFFLYKYSSYLKLAFTTNSLWGIVLIQTNRTVFSKICNALSSSASDRNFEMRGQGGRTKLKNAHWSSIVVFNSWDSQETWNFWKNKCTTKKLYVLSWNVLIQLVKSLKNFSIPTYRFWGNHIKVIKVGKLSHFSLRGH